MRRLLSAAETVAALFLLLIALLTAGNVLLRDVFSVQIPDWYDGSRMLQGIALFWGLALATCYGSHICVDIVWEHLRPRGRRALDVAATAVTLAFLAPLAWMVWVKVGSTGTQGTMDLRLPLVNFYAVAAVGMTVAAVLAAVRLVLLLRGREALLEPPALDAPAAPKASDGP
ncbi:TRAP transporter small permease [Ramlibacter tataouinensis]|uniref:TRAP transporter small permease protein n=1 Tax=Ramlibacter tataouinensis (strain ATCC BAA-407 / DSM 14655 / LMG 21543 / TTB310) TaxID=365046 RepID=F5Y5Z1_RAMTT|nr:TRAP transporter small permease [Ramlibacter tataouinensis]AEG91495.1 Candidate small permease component [Ramlibacter tataouinensis TTB310]